MTAPHIAAAMSALELAFDEMLNPPPYVPNAEEAESLSAALPHLLNAYYAHEREAGETATWNYHGGGATVGAWEITLRRTNTPASADTDPKGGDTK